MEVSTVTSQTSYHGVPTQPMLTNIYQHESLTFTYGGVLRDVVIDELWVH